MRALVIGHAGFIGRHLVKRLYELDYDLSLTEDFKLFKTRQHFGDKFDVIVHLGANIVNIDKRMKMGMRAFEDILLDYDVCQWVERNPPSKCFVVMSSCAVDFPSDPYCIVKRTLEAFALHLHKMRVPTMILRPFSGYGPDQSEEYPFRAIFERVIKKENPVTVWGGSQIRDWVYIDDLVEAIVYGIDNFPRGEPIEIGTKIGTSLSSLALEIINAVGTPLQIFCDPEKETSSSRRVAVDRSAELHGFAPKISLQEGIRKSVAYYKKQGRL